MPRYDYKCPVCEKVEEEVHRMDEKPVILCPDCKDEKGEPVRKVKLIPSGTNFYFPGIVGRWMEHNYNEYRGGKPEFSPNEVKEPPA